MSIKQERVEGTLPQPPPLLQHGLPPQMTYTPNTPPVMLMNPMNPIPRPPVLQQAPGAASSNTQETPSASSMPSPSAASTLVPMSEEDLNKRIDKASIKGTFGWETLDGANIPCIFRGGDKYVSVRMVEQKLLSKYPSTYPDELRNRPPLMSQFITQPESRLLNEINIEHCACEYGQRSFTEKDLVVRLKDFIEFYRIVKKHFPNELRAKEKSKQDRSAESSGGGWVQVNNTVVPYIRRHTPTTKEVLNLAPLPVLKYAAGLLADTAVPSLEPTDDECKLLSDMCKSAGLDFNFSHNTPLILLQQLPVYCSTKVIIKRLPDDDPFGNAEYCPEFDTEESKVAPMPMGGVVLPTMQDLSPQSYATRAPPAHMYGVGPPNVTVQPGSSIPFVTGNPGTKFANHGQRPDAGAQSLQALEKIAGPPRKKTKTSTSPAEMDPRRTPNGTQMSSPHAPQNGLPPNFFPGGPMRPMMISLPQGMPQFRPGQIPFGARPGMMPPPGILPGPSNPWPNAPTNPADMQTLAQMMNMQAAILSGPIGLTHQQPTIHVNGQAPAKSPNSQTSQVVPPAATGKTTPVNKPNAQAPKEKSQAKSKQREPNLEKIQPEDFHGKKISCLVKGEHNDKYALIEAISRVYYPHCSLEEFIKAMTNVLQIPIYQLDREEEKAFISFYGLPTSSLKCNKVLKLADLDKLMPQLKYMFKGSDGVLPPVQMGKPNVLQPEARQGQTPPSQAISQDTNNNGSSAVSSVSNSQPPPNPFTGGGKKSLGLGKLSKLEDAVNRLRHNKLMELEGKDVPPAAVPGAGVNELGQGMIPRNPFQPTK